MLLLTGVSDELQLTTVGAETIDVHASWVDDASTVITPGHTNTAIAAAGTVVVVPSPAASTQRNVQTLNIRNKDVTSNTVTVTHDDGVTPVELISYSLGANQQMQYIDGEGWRIIDELGQFLQSPNQAPAGVVPVGGIINWSGTIAAIAALAGWALCNGIDNAPGPDLRDKFIVGAKQDDAGVAKTNIRGSLEQSATATGHSHSAHADLTHTGITIADHTGLTHGVTIANHPDLTHAALSHAASTFAHADHSIASFSGTHASGTFSVPSGTFSVPSGTFASHTHASSAVGQASLTLSISSQGTARTIMTGSSVTVPSHTGASGTIASSTGTVASSTGTIASGTHSHAALTLTHSDHSFPSLSHQAIGTHVGTDYGVHTITPPAAHGAAGTLTHSFSQPSDHVISLHDVVSMVPSFYALAYIQRMS